MFSKACMYAIRAVVLLASHADAPARWTLPVIVKRTGAPEAFMAKILGKLVRAGILRSVKGPGGGFEVPAEKVRELRLGEVVRAIDGDSLFHGCALGFPRCDPKRPCPIHEQVSQVRHTLQATLADTRIMDLGEDLNEGTVFLRK